MKISKLFHWLYAFVMFLPIFAIGVTCLVTTFNKNVNSFTNDNETEYTQITDVNTFESGKIYNFSTKNIDLATTNTQLTLDLYLDVEQINFTSVNWFSSAVKKLTFYRIVGNPSNYVTIYAFDENGVTLGASTFAYNSAFLDFNFKFLRFNNQQNYSYFETLFFEFDTNTSSDNIANVFYYSVDKVTESPLFSWAYDSFLVAPFSYIVALFGIPTNHVVVELLSYWLAISIIWLVFDLIMYLPLLIHRWLDKGVLE